LDSRETPIPDAMPGGLSVADPAALRIESVTKRFGNVTALAGISLEVRARECLGLLGPNGAGKSTLVRSIVGRVRPDGGRVSVFGSEPESTSAREALGWVPQELALYWLLTCRENLEAFGSYQGLRGRPLREAVAWCLDWAALTDRAGSVVSTLSGGMKRRLNMAAGLIHRPRIVLLDEPTAGVDPQSRNRIFEMIEALRADGMTVIYTTHYMEEAERICDRIAIIDHGRVIAEGSKEQLVERSFGGRSDVVMRFSTKSPDAAAWAKSLGGAYGEDCARFAVEQPTEIAALLNSAGQHGLRVIDVALRRPNLESVFLQLTGRSLRE
jgi:ABC-2 type transport system ATP-binding protein